MERMRPSRTTRFARPSTKRFLLAAGAACTSAWGSCLSRLLPASTCRRDETYLQQDCCGSRIYQAYMYIKLIDIPHGDFTIIQPLPPWNVPALTLEPPSPLTSLQHPEHPAALMDFFHGYAGNADFFYACAGFFYA